MQSLTFSTGWTIQIDTAARQLTILKDTLIEWPRRQRTVEHCCRFDECSLVGVTYVDDDPHLSDAVYLDVKGRRVVILTWSASEASSLANELSVATGIPRLDIEEPS